MRQLNGLLPAVLAIFIIASLILFACGGDDDDNDDAADDAADDSAASDDTVGDDTAASDDADDDDTVPYDEHCQTFVHDFYANCANDLFGLTEDQAQSGCLEGLYGVPWDCLMECWDDTAGDCSQWATCIETECGIPVVDDDALF